MDRDPSDATQRPDTGELPPTAAFPARVGPGSILGGRYELGRSLGRGGMAEVFRARDTTLQRDVAIKAFSVDAFDTQPGHAARQAGEVRLLAGLSHPGLVTVFDAGSAGSAESARTFTYLVMELVDGPTLAERLATGALAPAEVAQLGAQLANALSYVHQRGVVHRDVKPANVLLAGGPGRPTAKLTDFGIARLLDDTRLTREGATLGTANYLSPEQARGEWVSAPSDVYSLGLVLLESLTGRVAYPGHGVAAVAGRLHRQPDVPVELGPGWGDVLRSMTAFDPAQRPDAATVATRLSALDASGDATTVFAALPDPAGYGPVTGSTASVTGTWEGGGRTADQTAILPTVGSPGARTRPPPSVWPLPVNEPQLPPATAPQTGWQPSAVPPPSRPRPSRRPLWIAAAVLVALAVVVVVIAVLASSGSNGSGRPDYPNVGGQLGRDLRNLQDAVG